MERECSEDSQLTESEIEQLLKHGEIKGGALAPWGSNYTYFVQVSLGSLKHRAVYKPRVGEAPLIDFPDGTLYLREYASYITSRWLGWNLIPQTVIRTGPKGIGTLQIYVEPETEPHIYSLQAEDIPQLQRLVLFDIIVNNADRKPAHVFRGKNHNVWAIDHGLTFHPRPKLRTVIWEFCGEPIPEDILIELESKVSDKSKVEELNKQLRELLTPLEIEAFWHRVESILKSRTYPILDPRRNIPYGFM